MRSNPAQRGGNREDNERWMRERQAQKREDAHLGKLARVRHPYSLSLKRAPEPWDDLDRRALEMLRQEGLR